MRRIAWSGMKRRRKQTARVLLAAALSIALFLFVSILRESMAETTREERLDTYGQWTGAFYSVTDAQEKVLEGMNPAVQTGKMEIEGKLLDKNGKESGGIGTIDEKARALGRIRIKQGRFPENADEIAIEEKTLKRLGIPWKEGSEIHVRIYHDTTEGETVERTYRLCGVVRDYSGKWQRNYEELVTGIVTEVEQTESSHLFFYSREYEDMEKIKELGALQVPRDGSTFVKNAAAYGKESRALENILENDILVIFIAAVSICIIFYIQMAQFGERRNTFLTLRGIGASKGQILLMLLWENVPVLGGAAVAGVTAGILLPALFLKLAGFRIVLSVPGIVGSVLSVAAALVFSTLMMYGAVQKLRVESSFSTRGSGKWKKYPKIRSIKPVTPFRTLMRRRKFMRRQILARNGILLAGGILTAAMAVASWTFYERYQVAGDSEDAGYEWQALVFGMELRELREIMDTEGIEKVEVSGGVDSADGWDSRMRVTWKGIEESSYIQEQELLRQDWIHALGVEELESLDSEMGQYYLSCVENDTVDREAFESGKEVILVLPSYVEKNGKPVTVPEKEFPYVKNLKNEESVKAGDEIRIFNSGGGTDVTVKVGGIIRRFPEKEPGQRQLAYRPGDIIVSEKFPNGENQWRYMLSHYFMEENGEEKLGLYVYAWADPGYPSAVLDEKFGNLIPERLAKFISHREEREEEKERAASFCFLAAGGAVVVLLICLLVLLNGQRMRFQEEGRRDRILRQLGMERSVFVRMYMGEAVAESAVMLLAGGFLVFAGYAGLAYAFTSINSVEGAVLYALRYLPWKVLFSVEAVCFLAYAGVNLAVCKEEKRWE